MKNIKTIFQNIIDKIKSFFNKKEIKESPVSRCLDICKTKIINSYKLCKDGEEKLNIILIYWSIIPMFVYFFVRKKLIFRGFFAGFIDIICLCLFCLDYFFIMKAVEKHPEYDEKRMKTIEKIEHYKTLTEEQIKEEEKADIKNSIKNSIINFVMGRSSDKVELYKIVRLMLLLFILVIIKRLLF